MRLSKVFFDTPIVKRSVDRAKRQGLSRAGAFIRTRARSSIRTRKRPSRPGSPPSSHTGMLRRFIFFGYDRSTDSVVVGPEKLNRPGSAPNVLEFGGTAEILRFTKGKFVKRKIHIKPRPYMGPALERELPNIPKAFRNTVRRG